MMRENNSQKNKVAGFTLVELIVVLVILAILAAILVPVLLGYIDRARRKQDLLEAKNCLTAAQVEFSSAYANKGNKKDGQVSVVSPDDVGCIDGKQYKNGDKLYNNDVYLYKNYRTDKKTFGKNSAKLLQYSEFAKKILKTAGYDKEEDYPYYLIIGAGHYEKYLDSDPHKPYTIYFAMFQKTKDSKPIFFDGTNWVEKYPKKSLPAGYRADYNFYTVNGEEIRIQYYLLSNKEEKGNWWDNLPANAEK